MTNPKYTSDQATYATYLEELKARAAEAVRRDVVMAKCEHWGHAEGEWKYSCCACSGMPGGCDNCSGIALEDLGLS